jgi:hypothetical protein
MMKRLVAVVLALAPSVSCDIGGPGWEFRSDVPAVAPPDRADDATSLVADVLERGGLVRPELNSLKWTGSTFDFKGKSASGLAWDCHVIVTWEGGAIARTALAHEMAHCAHTLTWPDEERDNIGHVDEYVWAVLVPRAEAALAEAGL